MYVTLRDDKVAGRRSGRQVGAPVAGSVVLLGVVSMLTDVSSEALTAILPLYLTSVVGLSMVAYGFVDGLYQGVSAITRIAAGYASDRQDRPKWVAASGYGLSVLARVGLLFSNGLMQITSVIAADRIGKGIRTAPRDAMISASSTPANLGRSFGVHRALDTLGAVIGPFVAFGILWWVVDGYDIVMAVSLAFAVLGLAVLLLLVPDIRPRRTASRAISEQHEQRCQVACTACRGMARADHTDGPREAFRLREAFTPDLVRLLVVAGMLSLVTVGDGFLYLALLNRSEFAAHWFPMLYVGTNVAYMALAIPFGRSADRLGRVRVFVSGHLFLLAAYACAIVPTPGTWATVLVLLLLGAFYAATDGVLAALAGRVVPVTGRASGIASAQTVVALARLVASTVFGGLWFLMGPTSALLAVGAVLAMLVLPAYLVVRPLEDLEAVAT